MTTYVEVLAGSGRQVVLLDGERRTIGTSADNDVVIDGDETVSRLHAVMTRYPSGWTIRDLGSRNGTSVNGDRLVAERALRDGDEILVGATRLVYRADPSQDRPGDTKGAEPLPDLTRRERDVLLELCRPVLGESLLTEPASVREIARRLVVTESAVKKHIGRLYDKFGLRDDAERRRGRLAAEAIRRGAIGLADLR